MTPFHNLTRDRQATCYIDIYEYIVNPHILLDICIIYSIFRTKYRKYVRKMRKVFAGLYLLCKKLIRNNTVFLHNSHVIYCLEAKDHPYPGLSRILHSLLRGGLFPRQAKSLFSSNLRCSWVSPYRQDSLRCRRKN